jgi:geranylgeranyl diphosphate synthase type II
MTKELVQRIEEEIKRFPFDGKPRSLYDPLRYMMSLGGKRMRPLLVLLAYRLYHDDPRPAIKYAAAVEAFHNFTLIHDDIMDQAPLRRGKPTVHRKWSVNTAILSGDVLLVKVYERFQDLEPAKIADVLRLLNECATAVCEGQQLDMEFEAAASVSVAAYLEMIRLKTAVLLGFSLELGAVLAGAPPSDRERLRQLGIDLGIAFQLKDDLLDVYGEKKKFGKQTGGDIIANKKTFLLISALKQARGKTAVTLKRWLKSRTFNNAAKVKAVKGIYNKLGIRTLAEAKINEYLDRAFNSLRQLSRKDRAAEIRAFAEELGGREK